MSDPYTSRVQAVAALLDVADLAADHQGHDDDDAQFTEQVAKTRRALRTLGVGTHDIDAAEALRARRTT